MSVADRKLGELHREAHSADQPPPFARSWGAAVARSGRPRRRIRAWVWAPAALLVAVLSVAGGLRIRGAQRQRDMAQEISLWAGRDPLGFLLETPSSQLLQTVPTFDRKGEWR